jgi:exosortase N
MDLSFPSARLIEKEKIFIGVLIAAALAGGAIAFPITFLTKSNELIGICLLPFVMSIQKTWKRFNYLFLVLFVSFGIAACVYGVRMFYFFALAFYILWLIEMFIGKVNVLTVFLLGFMSPFFSQVSAILGFPVRLQLSQWAGTILTWVGLDIQVEGNTLLLDGAMFMVDEACMGLNMLAISMLMGVFILAHNGRSFKTSLRLKHLVLFFAVCFALNLAANLFRIMVLVLFKVDPQNPAHEIVGILCLVAYVMIPVYLLGRWMMGRYGYQPEANANSFSLGNWGISVLVLIALGIVFTGVRIKNLRAQSSTPHATASMQGFESTKINDGVLKMVNDDILVYIKPIPEFFTGEHTPLLCWKGSGFEFKNISKSMICGREIYIGQLTNKDDKLFTAWWYSNGKVQTISQLDWRIRMLKGEEKFCLINITSNDATKLNQQIRMIFKKDLLQIKS